MIEIKNVTKIFNEKQANELIVLKNFNLKIQKSKLVLLKGVSGSGKSTILSLIAGLYRPNIGEIIVKNQSLSKLSLNYLSRFRRKNIGIIFQNFNLIPTLSTLDNILLPTLVDKEKKQNYANLLLEKFKLEDKSKILTKNLSGGEQQRVAIIRALINQPDIILADEPTANLDKKLSLELLDYLLFMKETNKTIIVATHDSLLLESKLSDEIIDVKKEN